MRRLFARADRPVHREIVLAVLAEAIDQTTRSTGYRLGENDWREGDSTDAFRALLDDPESTGEITLLAEGWQLMLDAHSPATVRLDHDDDALAERVLAALRPVLALEDDVAGEAKARELALRFAKAATHGPHTAARVWLGPGSIAKLSRGSLFRSGSRVVAEPWAGLRFDVEDRDTFERWLVETGLGPTSEGPGPSYVPSKVYPDPPAWARFALRRDLEEWARLGEAPSGVCIAGLDLRGIDLGGLEADVFEAAGADLTDAVLDEALLRHPDLQRACLAGAKAFQLVVLHAMAEGADLRGADLQGALIRDSDFRNARFTGADLRDAVFENCATDGADFTGVQTSADTRLPE